MGVRVTLLDNVTIIKNVKRNEPVWLRIRTRTGVDFLIRFAYLPTHGKVKHMCTNRCNLLDEDICMFKSKGRVLLLGDFNASVGDVDNIIGMLGEAFCNSNDTLLIHYSIIWI